MAAQEMICCDVGALLWYTDVVYIQMCRAFLIGGRAGFFDGRPGRFFVWEAGHVGHWMW